jgi:hypothetical protein
MKSVVAVLVAVVLFGSGCSQDSDATPPRIDDTTAAQLQARAFQRACIDVICAGAPIYARDSTSDAVRDAIAAQFTDEVQYLSDSQLEQRTDTDGRFPDGATLISVESVRSTSRADVKRVDVGISKGYRDYNGRTYLFVWKDDEWTDTSPDAVDVTVTSSVS